MFSAKFLRVVVFLFLCSFGVFLVWPEIDYAVSAIAFDPQTGFVFSELLFVKFLYELFAVIQWPVLLVLVYLIWGAWRKRNLSLRTNRYFFSFAFSLVQVCWLMKSSRRPPVENGRKIQLCFLEKGRLQIFSTFQGRAPLTAPL